MKVNKAKLGGAVYILPNLITSGNLFFGFLSILKSMQGELTWAALCILLGAIFDILDGRVARFTGSTSEFGVQYDSLCDLLSFGAAPAILMFQAGLHASGRVGVVVCFVFLACGALRLARFNVQSSIGKANGDFTGLPIPMAAGVLASYIFARNELSLISEMDWLPEVVRSVLVNEKIYLVLGMVMTALLGLLMVSNVNFRSHKNFKIQGLNPFKFLVIAVVLLGCIAINPELLGFLVFAGYALSGPIEYIMGGKTAVQDDEIFTQDYHQSVNSPSGDRED